MKTLWDKEKLLITSNFSLSPVFSTFSESFLPFLTNLKLTSAKALSGRKSPKLFVREWVKHQTEQSNEYFLCFAETRLKWCGFLSSDVKKSFSGSISVELFISGQKFRPVQIQSICRRQNKCDQQIIEISVGKGGKHSEKRRKCWLPAFSPFPTMFSKGLFPSVVKSRDCVVKSYLAN